ncbi:Hydroxymethylpyrimidine/phosphomethylpyrimidine kinase [Halorhabdus sp. SVX81]|uniref:bifunctional hydroxymethylpyrimidine kinase/phosphomethylpyrimidine kinase n=1 Tax=Halorhabdus sp. SVX81 TaxID=2978283 RepID=UPI0023DAB21B|nr:bifunctional hydroxymethylpyrimidine kinase/phosphomethylpyrimidine kinase [Halorhabdus sp. SVX81]WEL17278.1 Hydroxymethylpyrimidine/phosphomethylpyrimidine kinase [Halorhabdus sp. SVX81]
MTRNEAPHDPPTVLTIAGSDSGGGAGIQADLKAIEAAGGFGTSAITSVTAQNTTGVRGSHLLPIDHIAAQIDAVIDDFDVQATKTGMLATAEVIETVVEYADALPELVVDPVMVAASGDRLLEPEAEDAYERLIAEATLVTPNADEAAVLTGIEPVDESTAIEAGEAIVGMGADAALVKGGHIAGEDIVDVLVTPESVRTFRHERIDTDATHGSGCTLSAAIATHRGQGESLADSVGAGIDLLTRAVRYNLDVGEGPGAVHHLVETRERAERTATAEAVEALVADFVGEGDEAIQGDISALIPKVGTNVAGATPFAERPGEVAAVDGRITRTLAGPRPNRGVRFGASSHVARYLLDAREGDADCRFAVNWRYDERVAEALDTLDGEVVELDGRPTLESGFGTEFATVDDPVAVVDPGGEGRVPTTILLAHDPDTLRERTEQLLEVMA